MSAEVATQVRTSTNESPRGKRNNRSRGGGGTSNNNNNRGSNRAPRQGGNKKGKDAEAEPAESVVKAGQKQTQDLVQQMAAVTVSEAGDIEVCWICAEPIKYYAVSECNHRTCHVCAIRLRALYKKTDCTFCKVRYLLLNNSPEK